MKNEDFKQIMPPGARGNFTPDLYTRENWIAEEKLDGDRRIAQFCSWNDGKQVLVRFTGRRVSDKDGLLVEKTDCVPHLSQPFPVDAPQREPEPGVPIVPTHPVPLALLGTVLDGEMVSPVPGARSKDVTSIMGSKPEKAIAKQIERGWLNYVVFDCLFFQGKDIRHLPLWERRKYMFTAVSEWNNPYVKTAPYAPGGAIAPGNAWPPVFLSKEEFLMSIWGRKHPGEGIILKDIDSTYGNEKAWVKVKREFTEDAVVMGFDPPEQMTEKIETYLDENNVKQKRVLEVSESRLWANGWIGAIRFGQYKAYKLGDVIDARDSKGNLLVVSNADDIADFEIAKKCAPQLRDDGLLYMLTYCGSASGIDDAERADISANKDKWLGHVVEILANEREETGKFRHPRIVRFRDDKNPYDCIWGQK